MKETVNHPDHYKEDKYECIDVMVDIYGVEATKNFCKLNAFKYIWRSDKKGKDIEDMKKAKWYIDKYIELDEDFESDELHAPNNDLEPHVKYVVDDENSVNEIKKRYN